MNKRALLLFLGLFVTLLLPTVSGIHKVSAEHPTNKQYEFHWIDNQTISVSGPPFFNGNFSYVDQESNDATFRGTFDFSAVDGCDNEVTIQFFVDREDYESPNPETPSEIKGGTYVDGDSCDYVDNIIEHFNDGAVVGFTSSSDIESFTNLDGGGGEEEGSTASSCEELSGALGWILCPVILALDAGLNWLDTQINSLLLVEQSRYENPQMQEVAAIIRNIAFSILVPIALVMVIGTALGFEFISAYTVKRALPRLVVAVIFIALSYPLLTFFIQLVETVGAGIMGIMTAPFTDLASGNETVSDLSLADLFGPSIFSNIIAGLYFGAGAAILLWLFGSVLLLGIGIAFLLLMARQLFVVGLLLVAPLAILAWIFPGNDKLWKSWWGGFSNLLFLYPLIMAVIALGRVFAVIAKSNSGGSFVGETVEPLMALLAYMLPYAAIPFLFKFAGGMFATISNIANKPLNDQDAKRRRHDKRQVKKGRLGSENVFGGDGKLSNFGNKWASRVYAPGKSTAYALRKRNIPGISSYGRRLASGIHSESMDQTQNFFKKLNNEIGENDKAYRVLGGLHSGLSTVTQKRLQKAGLAERDSNGVMRGKVLTTEKDVNKAAEILSRGVSQSEREAGSALGRAANVVGSRFASPDTHYASVAGAATLGLAAHGFFGKNDVVDAREAIQSETKSYDFADSMMVQSELAVKDSMPHMKPGYGHDRDAEGNMIPGVDAGRDLDALSTYGPAELGRVKGDYFRDMDRAYKDVLAFQNPETKDALNAQVNGVDKSALSALAQEKLPEVEREFPEATSKEKTDMALELAKNDPRAAEIVRRQKAQKYSDAVTASLFAVASDMSYASSGVKEKAASMLKEAGIADRMRDLQKLAETNPALYHEVMKQLDGSGKPPE